MKLIHKMKLLYRKEYKCSYYFKLKKTVKMEIKPRGILNDSSAKFLGSCKTISWCKMS